MWWSSGNWSVITGHQLVTCIFKCRSGTYQPYIDMVGPPGYYATLTKEAVDPAV